MRKFQVIAALVIVVFLIGFIGCSENSPVVTPNSPPAKPGKLIFSSQRIFPLVYVNGYEEFSQFDTLKISGVFPNDQDNDEMYYRYNDDNGNINSWSNQTYTGGDSIFLGAITYSNPLQDTGVIYNLSWQVKDVKGDTSPWSAKNWIAVAHIDNIMDANKYITSNHDFERNYQMENNGLLCISVQLQSGSSIAAKLYDGGDNVVKDAYDVDSLTWSVPVNTSNKGTWKLVVYKTMGDAYVNIESIIMQFPPGANLGAFKPFVGKSRKSLK